MMDLRTTELNHEQHMAVLEWEIVNRLATEAQGPLRVQREHMLADSRHVVQDGDAPRCSLQQQLQSAQSKLRLQNIGHLNRPAAIVIDFLRRQITLAKCTKDLKLLHMFFFQKNQRLSQHLRPTTELDATPERPLTNAKQQSSEVHHSAIHRVTSERTDSAGDRGVTPKDSGRKKENRTMERGNRKFRKKCCGLPNNSPRFFDRRRNPSISTVSW